ncbi:unnamed protein product [Ilex paraguariensis]|uniref:Uncharacterized protein n=1 Tax=Ilex paraguariensis TaxID=185542 RepID=A0ABC8RNS6_9AQUA
MKISIFPSWVLGHRLWFLVFALSLALLGAWSKFYIQDRNYRTDQELSISKRLPSKGPDDPPVLAYWVFGSYGESRKILRLLKAIYHPRNQYLLQLDAEASDYERSNLAISVQSERVFRAFGNVNVVGRSYALNQMGASVLAATLHAAALLLKISADWDWFITLSSSDYPLMTQDDVLHAFSLLPRDLNFVNYTTSTEWKKQHNTNQIVVDPSLHLKTNSPIFYAVETRETPEAFQVFGGSPWMILSRAFMEHCVNGWEDNLPRKLLMYFSNVAFPLESYFHTVLCNSPQFQNTTVNNDLRYINWDTTKGEPAVLSMSNYDEIVSSEAVFVRPFKEDDPVLQELDDKVLNRKPNWVLPGKWCINQGMNMSMDSSKAAEEDLCSTWGDINLVRPGSHGMKLGKFLSKLVADKRLVPNHCHSSET